MSKERNIQTLLLDGGCHCFNFINTVHSRKEEYIFDYLKTYDDLLEWSDKVKLLPKERLRKLSENAKKNNRNAEKKLAEIKSIRCLYLKSFIISESNR